MRTAGPILPPFYTFRVISLLVLVCISCSFSRQDANNKSKSRSIAMETAQKDESPDWKKEARKMVANQLVARGIADENVLRVMENTPRHLFVPEHLAEAAYIDRPLPIGEGQTISQPYIVALMTELLALKGDEKVLEIGTGSGYQAAVLAQLVDTCYTIELLPKLADSANALFKQMGYTNIVAKCGDGYKGWLKHAPFDRIIITAAPPEIPPMLVEQLKPNGVMVVPVGKLYQELMLVTKTKKGIRKESIIPVRFVPMVKPD